MGVAPDPWLAKTEADAYRVLGDVDRPVSAYERALKLARAGPLDRSRISNTGWCLCNLVRFDEAINCLLCAWAIPPDGTSLISTGVGAPDVGAGRATLVYHAAPGAAHPLVTAGRQTSE